MNLEHAHCLLALQASQHAATAGGVVLVHEKYVFTHKHAPVSVTSASMRFGWGGLGDEGTFLLGDGEGTLFLGDGEGTFFLGDGALLAGDGFFVTACTVFCSCRRRSISAVHSRGRALTALQQRADAVGELPAFVLEGVAAECLPDCCGWHPVVYVDKYGLNQHTCCGDIGRRGILRKRYHPRGVHRSTTARQCEEDGKDAPQRDDVRRPSCPCHLTVYQCMKVSNKQLAAFTARRPKSRGTLHIKRRLRVAGCSKPQEPPVCTPPPCAAPTCVLSPSTWACFAQQPPRT